MKDIYSPIEIDESWDQRAPMIEGDMAYTGHMQEWAPQAEGNTATLEAPTSIAINGSSAEAPTVTTEEADQQYEAPTISTTRTGARETVPDSVAPLAEPAEVDDSAALEKLEGSTGTIDTDSAASDSGEVSKSQAGDVVMPSVQIHPDVPRIQNTDSQEQPTEEKAEVAKEPEVAAAQEDAHAEDDHGHFVLGDIAPSHSEAPPVDKHEAAEDHEPEGPLGEAMKSIQRGIEVLERAVGSKAAEVAKFAEDENGARVAKEAAQQELDDFNAQLDRLNSIK